MKKAIVTGANGFIGHHFVKELVENNYQVTAVIRNEEEDIRNIRDFEDVSIVYCDLSNIGKLPDMIGRADDSIFFHLAWAGNSGDGRGDYELQLENAKATAKAAESAAKLGCKRFVVTGSVTQLMYRDFLRQDNISPEIITCYAIGKMAAENMCKCVCTKAGIAYSWAYIANFYGEDDPTQNFINFLIQNYRKKETPVLTAGEQLADFMHVSDVARALKELGEKGKENTSYYIGYGEPKKLKDFIEIIHQKISPEIDSGIGRKPFQGLSIDFDKIDYQKFNRDTGFKPLVSFEEGIERVIKARMM